MVLEHGHPIFLFLANCSVYSLICSICLPLQMYRHVYVFLDEFKQKLKCWVQKPHQSRFLVFEKKAFKETLIYCINNSYLKILSLIFKIKTWTLGCAFTFWFPRVETTCTCFEPTVNLYPNLGPFHWFPKWTEQHFSYNFIWVSHFSAKIDSCGFWSQLFYSCTSDFLLFSKLEVHGSKNKTYFWGSK